MEAKGAPLVTDLRVVPVAGEDSMLMNLSGAHGPYFTRNVVILEDSAGNTLTASGPPPGGTFCPVNAAKVAIMST